MANETVLFFIHALTPLHVGAGRGVRFIDLPVIREKITGWPIVPGSAIKGVLADYYHATDAQRETNDKLRSAFGIADKGTVDGGMPNAGSLVFTDAHLICLPVRSLYGTFAWITSSIALKRFMRDLESAGKADGLSVPENPSEDILLIPSDTDSLLCREDRVFLEDHDFVCQEDDSTKNLAEKMANFLYGDASEWKQEFIKRFAVVPNEAFDFFSEMGTEVRARIRIEEQTKTVKEGALWYEEYLPAESVLAGLVWCDRIYGSSTLSATDLIGEYCQGELHLQMGGNATIGKGQVRMLFHQGGES